MMATVVKRRPLVLVAIGLMLGHRLAVAGQVTVNEASLALPAPSAHELRVL